MKFRKLLIFALTAGMLTGCESIDEDERFIGPVDFTPKKNVLIEDFTGQRCVNCPTASDAVHTLQQTYGAEHIIAVAIHGGSMSLPNTSPMGLATPIGEEYNSYWNVDSWPKGLVDRNGGLQEYTAWSASVINRIQLEPQVNLSMAHNSYDAKNRTINIQVDVTGNENITGKLQVWVVENNIVAYQSMPDGSHNAQYVHNHVFRDAVNGSWGEEITVSKDQTTTQNYTYQLAKDNWKAEDMAVVAFVYNDQQGVLQVIDAPVQ